MLLQNGLLVDHLGRIGSIVDNHQSQSLKASGLLKKLCNEPDLLNISEDWPGCASWFIDGYVPKEGRKTESKVEVWYSGKKLVLDRILEESRGRLRMRFSSSAIIPKDWMCLKSVSIRG